jgi:hypothetical protein
LGEFGGGTRQTQHDGDHQRPESYLYR